VVDRLFTPFNVIYMFSSSGRKITSFGDRLLIDQAIQTCPNLSIHRNHSICNHVMDGQMTLKAWFIIHSSLRVY